MAKRSKKVSLAPVISCVLAVLAVIMALLPVFTNRVKLTNSTSSLGLFDMLGDVFDGNSYSTWFSIDVLLYFAAFIMAILVIVFTLISIFANGKSSAKALNFIGIITGILGLLALIFAFIAVSDYNGSDAGILLSMSVNVWPILASVFCMAIPVCNYVIK